MARILIVDDDPNYLSAFREGLGAMGHHVTGCLSGTALKKTLEGAAFDVVFLDVFMDCGGAVSLIDIVTVHDPGLPVIVITGQVNAVAMPIMEERLQPARAVVVKSSTLREIDDHVRALCDPGGPGAQAPG